MGRFTHIFPGRIVGREAGSSPGRRRAVLCMSLVVIVLLLTYQLVLSRDALQSVSKWKLGGSHRPSHSDINVDDTNDSHSFTKIASLLLQQQHEEEEEKEEGAGALKSADGSSSHYDDHHHPVKPREKELVIAAMSSSNMSWVEDHVPDDWYANIYRADLAPGEAELTVPVNKGNEAMVFLT